MNKIFLPQTRRKGITTPKTNESQLNTARSVTNETNLKDSRLKNWNDVFGDFLSEALLKRKQTQIRRYTETTIDRAYIQEVPLSLNNLLIHSPSIRSNFAKFIQGEISAEEFINRKNRSEQYDKMLPTQQQKKKRPKINVSYRRSAVTDNGNHDINFLKLLDEKNEELIKKQQAGRRFDTIRELIEDKIEQRESEDLVKRSREMKNVGIIKYMYDVSDQYIQDLKHQNEKNICLQRKKFLQGDHISIIQHDNPYQNKKTRMLSKQKGFKQEIPVEKYVIRHLVDQKAQEYVNELRVKDYIENEKAKKRIFINYQFKKILEDSQNNSNQSFDQNETKIKRIYPFIQKDSKEKGKIIKNQLLNNDLELIKYITNYQKYDPFKDKEMQINATKDILIASGIKTKNLGKRIRKPVIKQNILKQQILCQDNDDSRTDNESLTSMYEFNVDNLYQQSRQLQTKLLEKQYTDGFSKTIKTIQKNESLKKTIITKNIQKLEGLSPL